MPELYASFLALWSVALLLLLANQWVRRRVATSVHVWYMVVLFRCGGGPRPSAS